MTDKNKILLNNYRRIALMVFVVFTLLYVGAILAYASISDAHHTAISAITGEEAKDARLSKPSFIMPVAVGFKAMGAHQCVTADYLIRGATGWHMVHVRLVRRIGGKWVAQEIVLDEQEIQSSCYAD